MFTKTVPMITENAVVKVGKFAYIGTSYDGILQPYLMRLRDRNKYPKPHQSTKRKGIN